MLHALTLSLQWGKLPDAALHRAALPRHKVARWLRHALASEAEITVRIVDASEGQALNRDYREKNYPTNLVAKEAKDQGKTLQAHYAHLIVHGALHAQGWDHELDEDAQVMELREAEIMARLGFENPYEGLSA